jgi:hypothetical protein
LPLAKVLLAKILLAKVGIPKNTFYLIQNLLFLFLSRPNSGSLHVAEEFSEDVLGWLNNNHGNSATLV